MTLARVRDTEAVIGARKADSRFPPVAEVEAGAPGKDSLAQVSAVAVPRHRRGRYLGPRAQDLAFEQAVGRSPKQRHHVRFWRSDRVDEDGRPVWLGAATYDCGVEFSRRTGQITHRIDADIDRERDTLVQDLRQAGF